MKIVANQRPPKQPIGAKANIVICPKCNAILEYGYEDMYPKTVNGEEDEYVKCMSCNTEIPIIKNVKL